MARLIFLNNMKFLNKLSAVGKTNFVFLKFGPSSSARHHEDANDPESFMDTNDTFFKAGQEVFAKEEMRLRDPQNPDKVVQTLNLKDAVNFQKILSHEEAKDLCLTDAESRLWARVTVDGEAYLTALSGSEGQNLNFTANPAEIQEIAAATKSSHKELVDADPYGKMPELAGAAPATNAERRNGMTAAEQVAAWNFDINSSEILTADGVEFGQGRARYITDAAPMASVGNIPNVSGFNGQTGEVFAATPSFNPNGRPTFESNTDISSDYTRDVRPGSTTAAEANIGSMAEARVADQERGYSTRSVGAVGERVINGPLEDGKVAGERLLQEQDNLDRFYKSMDSWMGKGMRSVAKNLEKSDLNKKGHREEDIMKFFVDNGVMENHDANELPLLNWGLSFNCIEKGLVTRPNIDQANKVVEFLTGEYNGTLESNVNAYAASTLDKPTDTKVMNEYFMDFEEAVDKIDGALYKNYFFGIVRENKGEYKEINRLADIAKDASKTPAERREAAKKAWDMLVDEFGDDVAKERRKMIESFESEYEKQAFIIGGKTYEWKHSTKKDENGEKYSQWLLKPEDGKKFQPIEEVLNAAQIRNFERKVGGSILKFAEEDGNTSFTKSYERSQKRLEAVEAGMQEVQRDMIIANIASYRAEGKSLVSLRTGAERERIITKCIQSTPAYSTQPKLVDDPAVRARVAAKLDRMIAAEQGSVEQYLADAKANWINEGPLTAVPRGDTVRVGTAYHGPDAADPNFDFSKLSWESLKGMYPEENPYANKKGKELSSAYLIAESFALQGYQFSEAQFKQGFDNLQPGTVESFRLTDDLVKNTSANGKADETWKNLDAKDPIFKLAPIQSEPRSIVVRGQQVDVTFTYDVYLRSGCMNPLIVPRMQNLDPLFIQIAEQIKYECYTDNQPIPATTEQLAPYISLPKGVAGTESQIMAIPTIIKGLLLAGALSGGGGAAEILKEPDVPLPPKFP